jgi:hypothetical protein
VAYWLAALLSAELPHDGLQHAGNAILTARVDNADAALAKITTELIDALRARGWDGDDDLANALGRVFRLRRTGGGATGSGRP